MAEDIIREAGYMLPQGDSALEVFALSAQYGTTDGFPRESVEKAYWKLLSEHKEEKKMRNSTFDNLMEAFAGEAQATEKIWHFQKSRKRTAKTNAAKTVVSSIRRRNPARIKAFRGRREIHSTAENLKDSVAGETHEYKEMYPDFVKQAEAEGNKAAASYLYFRHEGRRRYMPALSGGARES
jgi:hypothetical protein